VDGQTAMAEPLTQRPKPERPNGDLPPTWLWREFKWITEELNRQMVVTGPYKYKRRGKPLRSFRTIVELIAGTTTDAGLEVRAELDENKYATKVKVSKGELATVNLSRHPFHGDWNYTVSPNRRKK
jgi:Rhodopirellula transposase DDE domain